MNETYTFSRALHMMRYGGKKMKFIGWQDGLFVSIVNEKLQMQYSIGIKGTPEQILEMFEIMGSWVEVK